MRIASKFNKGVAFGITIGLFNRCIAFSPVSHQTTSGILSRQTIALQQTSQDFESSGRGENGKTKPYTVSRRSVLTSALLGASFGLLSGGSEVKAAVKANADEFDLTLERVYDTHRKSYLPANAAKLLQPASYASDRTFRVVCIGEEHSNPLHHRLQFDVIKTIHKNFPQQQTSIGLEMFYKQHQPALDQYIFSGGSLAQLKTDTQWDTTWGYDLNCYAKIFQFAKQNKIRLIGLNAPAELVRVVSKDGLQSLPDPLKPFIPEMDLKNRSHWLRFRRYMAGMEGVHGPMSPDILRRMYECQTLWDEYMADTAANYLKSNPDSRLIVLAGRGHIEDRDGVPDRIARRIGWKTGPGPEEGLATESDGTATANGRASGGYVFTIVPQSIAFEPETRMPKVEWPRTAQFADWVWYTQTASG